MAGSVLGIAFSLLFLASINQGAKNADLFLYKTMEAEVGQNITIPCIMKDATNHKIVSIRWMKNGGTNLAVYNPMHGQHQYWPNVTIQVKVDGANQLLGSHLHIPWVNKWDSGIYRCEIATFLSGYFTDDIKLTVKDEIKLLCNADKVVEVHFGDNVTIQCTVNSNAQYMWTKNNELVSENDSLELWRVTEAHAGAYNLTVNTGDKSLHKDFIISVLTTTTILRTGSTESTPAPTNSPHTSTATSLTTTLSTDIHWTTQPNSSTVIVPVATPVSVPSSPDTQTITNHLLNSSMSTQRMAGDLTQNESGFNIKSPEDIFSMSTKESRTTEDILESREQPGATSFGSLTSTEQDKETKRSHMLVVFIIVLLLLLIVVAVILYRRQLIKKRMDLPPPFKPPPPPVKYTAARQSETELFPTSRCNSLSAPMRPIFI